MLRIGSSHTRRSRKLLAIVSIWVLLTLSGVSNILARPSQAAPLADMDATFAVQWMQAFYDSVQTATVNAPAASRVYAYAGVTLYESVVPGMPGYVSLSTQLKAMPAMPTPAADQTWDYPSIANAALSTVLVSLIPDEKVAPIAKQLRDQQTAARKGSVDAKIVEDSLVQGDKLGAAIIAWIALDNYKESLTKTYSLPTDTAYAYVITSPGTKPVGAYWGTLRSFSMTDNGICNVARNIEYSTDKNSTFYKMAMEVVNVRKTLTQDQKDTANFWVDTPGITGAPAGHWMSIASQLVTQLNLKLGRAAEMYAMIGMALGDSFISCWHNKYEDPLMRPETYIKRNIQPDWAPFIQTPPFPSYPSGHSVASGAAAEVLTGLFGQTVFVDATGTARLKVPARTYYSFEQAANEAALSRLFGGIHYRFDNENGLRQGRCVGAKLLSAINLKVS